MKKVKMTIKIGSFTGNITSGSNVITNIDNENFSSQNLVEGLIIKGIGIPSDTTISTVGTDITISNNATQTLTEEFFTVLTDEVQVNNSENLGGYGPDHYLSEIPIATATTFGGIKASTRSTENVEVKIDISTGKAYVPTYPTDTGEDNIIEEVQIDSSALTPSGKAVNIPMATTAVKGVGLLSSVITSDGFGENNKLVTETHAKLIYDDLDGTCDYLLGLLEA